MPPGVFRQSLWFKGSNLETRHLAKLRGAEVIKPLLFYMIRTVQYRSILSNLKD
jgi:hypothetical protein